MKEKARLRDDETRYRNRETEIDREKKLTQRSEKHDIDRPRDKKR